MQPSAITVGAPGPIIGALPPTNVPDLHLILLRVLLACNYLSLQTKGIFLRFSFFCCLQFLVPDSLRKLSAASGILLVILNTCLTGSWITSSLPVRVYGIIIICPPFSPKLTTCTSDTSKMLPLVVTLTEFSHELFAHDCADGYYLANEVFGCFHISPNCAVSIVSLSKMIFESLEASFHEQLTCVCVKLWHCSDDLLIIRYSHLASLSFSSMLTLCRTLRHASVASALPIMQ